MPESFHFLNPQWLWLLLPTGLVLWRLWRRADGDNPWRRVLEPGLQPLLLDSADDQGRRGQRHWLALLAVGWLLAVLALANPAWERVPSPVYASQSARVVVLDLSLSMLARDIAPDRLTRARFKVEDILRLAGEGQVGLVVFAGDAFSVTPLTRDEGTLRSQLRVLEPGIMPVQGSRADLGLRQAGQLLRQAGLQQGQVLLLADGVEGDAAAVAAAELRQQGYRVGVLGVGTAEGAPLTNAEGRWLYAADGQVIVPRLEERKLREIAAEGDGLFVTISDDDSDVRALLGGATAAPEGGPMDEAQAPRWKERGPWLVVLLLPLAALAFRRGWLFSVAFCALSLTPPEPALAASQAIAEQTGPGYWERLWRTPEQRADRALRNGDFELAATLSEEPLRRGVAKYRRGEYAAALADFEQAQGAQASYNRGNALARLGRYQEAIAAYQDALEAQPDMQDAGVNKKAVEDLLENLNEQEQQGQQQRQQSPQPKQDQGPPQDQAGEQADQPQGESAQQSGDPGQSQGQPQADAEAQEDRNGQQGQSGQESQAGEGRDGESPSQGEADQDARQGASGDAPNQDQEAPSTQAQAGAGQRQENQSAGEGDKDEKSKGMAGDKARDAAARAGGESDGAADRNVFSEALKDMVRREQTDDMSQGPRAGSGTVSNDSLPSAQGRAKAEDLNSEERLAAEQWLRRIPDDPGGLLRRKFQYQYQQRRRGPDDRNAQGW